MSYTKGEWKYSYYENTKNVCPCVYSPKKNGDIGICDINENVKEWEDNARLIASAPDLLEALKEANRIFTLARIGNFVSEKDFNKYWNKSNKAIAKAEGK